MRLKVESFKAPLAVVTDEGGTLADNFEDAA